MNFKKVLISELKPAAYNPRKNLSEKDPEYQRIKKSIETFGYVDPVIVNSDYTVIGGHQRLKVLKEMGEASIDVVVVDLPKDQEKALNVALNKITGDWDMQQLSIVLSELKEADFDISITGFSDKELADIDKELFGEKVTLDTEPQISRAEELRKEWGTELGQMWQCGEHRVICGDCTDPSVVGRVMQGEKADLVFTDPPYNVAGNGRNYAADCSKAMNDLKNASWDKDFNPDQALEVIEKNLAKDCAVYICTSQFLVQKIWDWMAKWSDFNSYCVWCKPNPMPSLAKRHWTWATELIPYAVRGKHICNFPDGNHALNWWDIVKEKNTDHPTEKPITVPSRAISFSSNRGAVVLDPFLGSGTTMIACENLGRKCRGAEIDPGYVAVILQRYKDTFPGKEIRLIQDGGK